MNIKKLLTFGSVVLGSAVVMASIPIAFKSAYAAERDKDPEAIMVLRKTVCTLSRSTELQKQGKPPYKMGVTLKGELDSRLKGLATGYVGQNVATAELLQAVLDHYDTTHAPRSPSSREANPLEEKGKSSASAAASGGADVSNEFEEAMSKLKEENAELATQLAEAKTKLAEAEAKQMETAARLEQEKENRRELTEQLERLMTRSGEAVTPKSRPLLDTSCSEYRFSAAIDDSRRSLGSNTSPLSVSGTPTHRSGVPSHKSGRK